MSTTGLVDTKRRAGPTKRRQYSDALKRQMVAETQAPGASVLIAARRHDVNSNQLFRWRRQLLPKAVVESGIGETFPNHRDASKPRQFRARERRRDGGGVSASGVGWEDTRTAIA